MSNTGGDIQSCDWVFQFQCPQRWERLAPTDDPLVRACDVCLKHVYYCATDEEVTAHAALAHCVAIPTIMDDGSDDYTTLGAVVVEDEPQ